MATEIVQVVDEGETAVATPTDHQKDTKDSNASYWLFGGALFAVLLVGGVFIWQKRE